MNFLPNATLLNVILLIFLLLFVLIFSLFLLHIYRFLSKWLLLLHREKVSGAERIKDRAHTEALSILDEARNKALKIISDASAKADKALDAVDDLSSDSKKQLSEQMKTMVDQQEAILKNTSAEFLGTYKDVLQKQKQESLKSLEDASSKVESEIISEVGAFKDLLEAETIGTTKAVQEKVAKEYQEIEKELSLYKNRKLKEIDENIYDIITNVTKKVLGESLSIEDHQELIIKALEEAKRDNIFPIKNSK